MIYLGSYSLDTTKYYGNTSLTMYLFTQFQIPYLSSHPLMYHRGVSIQKLSYDISASYQINMSISGIYNLAVTNMNIVVFSTSQNKLSALTVRYIVLDIGFSKLSIY
jgi:hypothetical protein